MCGRIFCPFRSAAPEVEIDDLTRILIFGVTGMTGGAVMEAALCCAWFKVRGFTRAREGLWYEELIGKGIEVAVGDMSQYQSLVTAMQDIDCIFLNTHFWESMTVETEYLQGFNVVNAAIQAGVKHLIYAGTEYTSLTADEICRFLEGKARVECYIINAGIPCTVVHMGFFYENLNSVFKPHPIGKNRYAIAFPMGDVGLNMGSVMDFGHCIARIALRPAYYTYRTMKLSSAYMTVDEIVKTFNDYFEGYGVAFVNPRISLLEYRSLGFQGVEEMASMWQHYRGNKQWDTEETYKLNHRNNSLEAFIVGMEKVFLDLLGADKPSDISDSDNTVDSKPRRSLLEFIKK